MKEAILSAKDVVKQFPGSSQEPVLNHIDIEIYDGDLTIIMGPSGGRKIHSALRSEWYGRHQRRNSHL